MAIIRSTYSYTMAIMLGVWPFRFCNAREEQNKKTMYLVSVELSSGTKLNLVFALQTTIKLANKEPQPS
jgi:hypothetical protein